MLSWHPKTIPRHSEIKWKCEKRNYINYRHFRYSHLSIFSVNAGMKGDKLRRSRLDNSWYIDFGVFCVQYSIPLNCDHWCICLMYHKSCLLSLPPSFKRITLALSDIPLERNSASKKPHICEPSLGEGVRGRGSRGGGLSIWLLPMGTKCTYAVAMRDQNW